ncbi:LOW QUALITY PROTEIN: microprocessor complex subunit DGCR8-like [Paramacrobiotus metropolitanus]|uniref:LOW QUALITY PROTEIN: microprocessor complex subunit DGCR8-like n=1 Tax=Paramacrobiotus metropolitanus TaxID=2943436 RepID=UPI00244603B8|nr:LOW QUALITY PROTEIN: microprocessor complex subunit DGCR8-like [Paramacrobiotus metropolitanus]
MWQPHPNRSSHSRSHPDPSHHRPAVTSPPRKRCKRGSPEDGEIDAADHSDSDLSAISSSSETKRSPAAPPTSTGGPRRTLLGDPPTGLQGVGEAEGAETMGNLGDLSMSPGRLTEALAVLVDPYADQPMGNNGEGMEFPSFLGGDQAPGDLSFGAMNFADDLFDMASQESLLNFHFPVHPDPYPASQPAEITPYDLYGSPLSSAAPSPATTPPHRIFAATDPDLDEYPSASESASSGDEMDASQVDALLDELDPDTVPGGERTPLVKTKNKFIMIEKRNHLFEFLPQGWLQVLHESGMPVYCHRESRICTLSRPYGLGKASLRTHKIPLSAVPCMEYKRCKEQEAGGGDGGRFEEAVKQEPVSGSDASQPTPSTSEPVTARVMTADEHYQTTLISPDEFRTYCQSLFEFRMKTIRRYKNWKIGRARQRLAKKLKASNSETTGEPDKPDTEVTTMLKKTRVVTITRPGPDENVPITFTLNPTNKTVVSILHEFVQHMKKTQPLYEFLEMPDSNAPYQAVVSIDGKEEGRGLGASKKQAKMAAAKEALLSMAPEMRAIVGVTDGEEEEDIFHDIAIDDPRIWEISFKAGIPAPYEILTRALRRTHRSEPIRIESKRLGHLKNEYTMTCGDLTIAVISQKRDAARHLCAQKLLKKIHPELQYYGQVLKMYGTAQQRHLQKKKEVQRTITDLQTKAKLGQPNWELLEKLKTEMAKVVAVPLRSGEKAGFAMIEKHTRICFLQEKRGVYFPP